jgi:hypothetical protein
MRILQRFQIILDTILLECEMWSLTVRGEHKLQIFEEKVLKTYLELWKLKESFKVLQNEEFCFLNRSSSAVRRVKHRELRTGHVARNGETFCKNISGRMRSKWRVSLEFGHNKHTQHKGRMTHHYRKNMAPHN